MDFREAVRNAFSKRQIATELFVYELVGSTNTEAKRYAECDVSHTDAFFIAERQSAGRGRMGRSFSSERGGLYLSYLCHPEMRASDALMLTVYAAVSVCDAVRELTGAMPRIKWVNDVFLGDRKLAGILTEGAFSGVEDSFDYAVVGIGINLHKREFPEELAGIATDLESECGVHIDVAEFAAALAERLSRFETASREEYMEKYRAASAVLGKRIQVVSSSGSFGATAVAIEDNGSLTVIPDGDAAPVSVFTGEVSIRF